MPEDWVKLWTDVLSKPEQVFAKQKKNSSIAEGAKQYAVAGIIGGLAAGLVAVFLSEMFPVQAEVYKQYGVAAIAVAPAMGAIGGILFSLVIAGIVFLFAKLLGGNGSFNEQYYLAALFAVPLAVANLAGYLPTVGGPLNLLVFLFMLYLLTLSLKEAHKLSTGKAVASWLVPLVIFIALLVVALAIVASSIGLDNLLAALPKA